MWYSSFGVRFCSAFFTSWLAEIPPPSDFVTASFLNKESRNQRWGVPTKRWDSVTIDTIFHAVFFARVGYVSPPGMLLRIHRKSRDMPLRTQHGEFLFRFGVVGCHGPPKSLHPRNKMKVAFLLHYPPCPPPPPRPPNERWCRLCLEWMPLPRPRREC